ncbi:MAG: hypothetical protein JKY62_14810 [Desulfocapsa sp.]|nr:hypothetical protein [Desulfocapsa sp.]
MKKIATPTQIQELVRIAKDKNYSDLPEFIAFNCKELFGYKPKLNTLTLDEFEKLKLYGK